MRKGLGLIAATALLGACSGGLVPGGGSASGGTVQSTRPATSPPTAPFRAPRVQRAQGLEGIMGQNAQALMRRFGQPRINLAEGDARKLQFVGGGCVLDIYLYPITAGAEPVASHVETRLRKGGGMIESAQCVRAVEAAQ